MLESLHMLYLGLTELVSSYALVMCGFGGVLGVIIGALPGLGATAGCALLLPITYSMDPTVALVTLAAVYYGDMFGGGISAILINIPGDSHAAVTALDGYAMSRKGQAGKALFVGFFSSFVGGMLGANCSDAYGLAAHKYRPRIRRAGDGGGYSRGYDQHRLDTRRTPHIRDLSPQGWSVFATIGMERSQRSPLCLRSDCSCTGHPVCSRVHWAFRPVDGHSVLSSTAFSRKKSTTTKTHVQGQHSKARTSLSAWCRYICAVRRRDSLSVCCRDPVRRSPHSSPISLRAREQARQGDGHRHSRGRRDCRVC